MPSNTGGCCGKPWKCTVCGSNRSGRIAIDTLVSVQVEVVALLDFDGRRGEVRRQRVEHDLGRRLAGHVGEAEGVEMPAVGHRDEAVAGGEVLARDVAHVVRYLLDLAGGVDVPLFPGPHCTNTAALAGAAAPSAARAADASRALRNVLAIIMVRLLRLSSALCGAPARRRGQVRTCSKVARYLGSGGVIRNHGLFTGSP